MLLGFCLAVLEYCSAVWCSAADTHLKLLDHALSGARFLTGGVFECDISHHRSVAVLCMLYKIRCYPVYPLNGALPTPYVPVYIRCSGCTSVHLCTASLQNLAVQQNFYSISVSLWNDLANPIFDGVGLVGFKSKANASLLA